jgi:O-antigen ligase
MASHKEGKLALIIFAVAIFFSYTHPYHIHPHRTFYHDLIACLGLISSMVYFVVSRPAPLPGHSAALHLRLPFLLALPLGIVLVILLQILLGMISPATLAGIPVMYLLLFAVALIFGASLALDTARIERAVSAIALAHVLAAAVSLVFQHVQIMGLDATPVVMYMAKSPHAALRPFANVAQPNQLALLYFFALAGLWYFYRAGKLPPVVCSIIAALLLWGTVLTQSRIGWILVPLFFAYTLGTLGQQGKRKHTAIAVLAALMLLYLALILLLPQISQAIGFDAVSVTEHVGGRSERTGLWQAAWQLAAQHPWLGTGWFGYGVGQVSVASLFASSTYAEHAHNLPLNLATELGWPAAIIIMTGLCWWFYQTCLKPAKSLALQFCSLCFFAVGVHSMVEFPLWYAFVLLPVGVMMGLVHQMRWPDAGTIVKPGVVLAAYVCAFLVMAGIILDYQRVVGGFKALRVVQQGMRTDENFLRKPDFTLFPQFFEYFKLTRIKPREGMSAEEIAYVESWSPRFGFVHILNLQAEVYVLNGQPKKAAHTLLTLQRLHPIPYPEYYDYWKAKGGEDPRYQAVFETMPARTAP